MGHPLLGISPALFAVSTLWVREHNRVCDLLSGQWPAWADQRLYETARRIVTGEMMGIAVNEIVNAHAARPFLPRYKPEAFHGEQNSDGRNAKSVHHTPLELLLTAVGTSGLSSGRGENVPSGTVRMFGDNR